MLGEGGWGGGWVNRYMKIPLYNPDNRMSGLPTYHRNTMLRNITEMGSDTGFFLVEHLESMTSEPWVSARITEDHLHMHICMHGV